MSEKHLWFRGETDHQEICKNVYVPNLKHPSDFSSQILIYK